MEAHQERVVVEKTELDEKRHALAKFIGTELFKDQSRGEQGRLSRQLGCMNAYALVLGERIAAFG